MLVTEEKLSSALSALSKSDITSSLPKYTFHHVQKCLQIAIYAGRSLPHEQKSILVDATWLKRSKKNQNTEWMPMETMPVCMEHVQAGARNVGLAEDDHFSPLSCME